MHTFMSNDEAKAALRAAMEEINTEKDVFYFPASETYPRLREMVIGQDRVLSQIADAIEESSVMVKSEQTLANIFLLGPPGVGKTQTGRALAKVLFGGPEYFCLVPGNSSKDIANLLGLSSTYQNSKQGFVIQHIITYNKGVLMLDELDRAGKDMENMWYQALENGKIRSNYDDKDYSLRNYVVVAASNYQHEMLTSMLETFRDKVTRIVDEQKLQDAVKKALENRFEDAFLSRFNYVGPVNKLSPADRGDIALMKLHLLAEACEGKIVDNGIGTGIIRLIKFIMQDETMKTMRDLDRLLRKVAAKKISLAVRSGLREFAVDYRPGSTNRAIDGEFIVLDPREGNKIEEVRTVTSKPARSVAPANYSPAASQRASGEITTKRGIDLDAIIPEAEEPNETVAEEVETETPELPPSPPVPPRRRMPFIGTMSGDVDDDAMFG